VAHMPRYYFHLDEDRDRAGTELPDDATARRAGVQTFGEMIREAAVPPDSEMMVTDAAGRQLLRLRFGVT
jgi:hypothetical protein